jgi:long-chain acyl-CoA synthetase
MNLAAAFVKRAESHPDRTAIFCGGAEYSYGTILGQARHLAARLEKDHGIRPGDRVGVWLHNCPEFVPVLFGVWLAGGAVVMINHFLKAEEVSFLLQDSGARAVLSGNSLNDARKKVGALCPDVHFLSIEDIPAAPGPEPFEASSATEEDLAALLYTSGTTGHPKGAMLTHGNFLHNVASCLAMLEVIESDRLVVLLPQFHSFMFTVGTLVPMLGGAAIVLIRSLHPLKGAIEEIAALRATILPAVPQVYRALTQMPGAVNLPLRLCVTGGAPMPLEVLREFNAKFPGLVLREGYGPTESSPVASINPIRGRSIEGSIGVPIPNVEMSIRDEAGNELPDGTTGEICIRGGNVMRGYWKQPEETAKVLRDGWLYTGDVGHRNSDGFYFITDRKKDMLLVNGINVYPREIEEVMYRYPGVKEAAVIGLPDARRGEQPCAFVVPNEGATLDEKSLLNFIREKLADYKVPRRIVLLDKLPRNPTGKILKTALKQMRIKDGDQP